MTLFLIILLSILLCWPSYLCISNSDLRSSISLNGKWKFYISDSPSIPKENILWEDINIPSLVYNNGLTTNHYIWFKTDFAIPDTWGKTRIFLKINSARFSPAVYINQEFITNRIDGWTPFTSEITSFVKTGNYNRLLIRCADWTATFDPCYSLPSNTSYDWDMLRKEPKGKIIAPIGGNYQLMGISDDVSLISLPHAFIENFKIISSYRLWNIQLTGKVSQPPPNSYIEATFTDTVNNQVLMKIQLNVDSNGNFNSKRRLPYNTKLWSPENPFLYELELKLINSEGKVIDRLKQKIGIREFYTIKGDFFLNGIKRHLLATSGWPPEQPVNSEYAMQMLSELKKANINTIRFHTQPWQKCWIEAADVTGLFVINEASLWCDCIAYAFLDSRFWTNVYEHIKGIIERDFNNPSFVILSLENELLYCGGLKYDSNLESKLAGLAYEIRRFDPHHLIFFEADLDPCKSADIIGLHYPHELPHYTDYPNTADWLLKKIDKVEKDKDPFWGKVKNFRWDKSKPLYIGEYLWVPSQDYTPATVFFGDDAYLDRKGYKLQAKAIAWWYQTIAYRRADVSGICPWTIINKGKLVSPDNPLFITQKNAYEHVAAFLRESYVHFYGNSKIERNFDIFNDTANTLKVKLHYMLENAQENTTLPFVLDAGSLCKKTVSIRLPPVDRRTSLIFRWYLTAGTNILFHSFQNLEIFPEVKPYEPSGVNILVFEKKHPLISLAKDWAKISKIKNIKVIHDLDELKGVNPDFTVLIIAPYALSSDSFHPLTIFRNKTAEILLDFIEAGGRALVLEQDNINALGLDLKMIPFNSTIAFPVTYDHPVFKNLDKEDLKFWQKDHLVSIKQIVRPDYGGIIPLIVTGGEKGLNQSPLLEIPVKRGKILLCQLLVGSKLNVEPVCNLLLNNILDYLSEKPQPYEKEKTLLLSSSEEFCSSLDRIKLSYQKPHDVSVDEITKELEKFKVILTSHNAELIISNISYYTEWLKNDHTRILYWYEPDAESLLKFCMTADFPSLTIMPKNGVINIPKEKHPLLKFVLREDIIYKKSSEKQKYENWIEDPSAISSWIIPYVDVAQCERIEAESMKFDPQTVKVSGDSKSIILKPNTKCSLEIDVPQTGLYTLTLIAQSSGKKKPVEIQILTNDYIVSTLSIPTELEPISTILMFHKGKCNLSLANSKSIDDKDYVSIDALLISKKSISPDNLYYPFTLPGMAFVQKNSGMLIIDCINWITEDINSFKGKRFASVFFRSIGVDFKTIRYPDLKITPSDMTVVSGKYIKKDLYFISFYTEGSTSCTITNRIANKYKVYIEGYSTPVSNEYASVLLKIGEHELGTELSSSNLTVLSLGEIYLKEGIYNLTLSFINDLFIPPYDRNAFISSIIFKRKDP